MSAPLVTGFYHEPTLSIAYLVARRAGHAAIIDPVLDYDEKCRTGLDEFADEMLRVPSSGA